MGRYEIEQVEGFRERFRASWQACAQMVGRSVHDVRLACDPDYQPLGDCGAAAKPRLRLRDFDETSLRILGALSEFGQAYAAGARDVRDATVTDIRQRLDLGANKVGALLPELERRDVVVSRRLPTGRFGWRLSTLGRDLVGADG